MFRFTIRELVLLTIIIGIGLAWWIDHAGKMELRHMAEIMERVLTSDGWTVKKGHWEIEVNRTGNPGRSTSYKSKHVNSEWVLPFP
ncbi:MAG: hypothetical protein SFU86_09130 [Pirellulaceae bacterium]|nr:hypothetical protein [Pirellulaceae bacterium]